MHCAKRTAKGRQWELRIERQYDFQFDPLAKTTCPRPHDVDLEQQALHIGNNLDDP
ncbi:hypothetical protein [Luteimonas salinilitoris]|uniref:Uncharacterized protein n=1 Tax=Luteimonas salinilitoris TaxID=3237697 RepID=A0ABV4HK08_9GAMM